MQIKNIVMKSSNKFVFLNGCKIMIVFAMVGVGYLWKTLHAPRLDSSREIYPLMLQNIV